MTTQHPQTDAALAELFDILNEYGVIVPEVVVERAADKDNPLHRHFEWDDRAAGHAYRLSQVRTLVRRYHIDIPEREVMVRRFVSVDVGNSNGRGYVETTQALSDPFLRRQILDRMNAEVAALADRYRRYSEAAGLVKVIDRWLHEAEGPRAASGG